MTIAEYAGAQGITVQRAAQLARAGKIPARKVGGRWVVEGDRTVHPTRRALSASSKADLVTFLAKKTMDHVTGYRRQRLAERVRALAEAENRAALLREWFLGSTAAVRPGEALVAAAQQGEDRSVNQILEFLVRGTPYLVSAPSVSTAFRDARMIAGMSLAQLSGASGVPSALCRELERQGTVPGGNLTARKIERALGFRSIKLIVKEPAHA